MTPRADRDHHISAVVDQFLAEPAGFAPAAGPSPETTAGRLRFAVAAADTGLLAAGVCARLAFASLKAPLSPGAGGPRVAIEEWHRQPWSAAPFLGGCDREHLRRLFRPGAFGGPAGEPRGWAGGVEIMPPRLNGDADASAGGVRIVWVNLGRLGRAALEALEVLRAWDGGAPLAGGLDGLVWCRDGERRARLRDVYRLGRLVAAMAPRQLRLVRVGVPGGAAAAADLAREEALARRVAPGLPLEALQVPRRALAVRGGADDVLARLAAGMALAATAGPRGRAAVAGAGA